MCVVQLLTMLTQLFPHWSSDLAWNVSKSNYYNIFTTIFAKKKSLWENLYFLLQARFMKCEQNAIPVMMSWVSSSPSIWAAVHPACSHKGVCSWCTCASKDSPGLKPVQFALAKLQQYQDYFLYATTYLLGLSLFVSLSLCQSLFLSVCGSVCMCACVCFLLGQSSHSIKNHEKLLNSIKV